MDESKSPEELYKRPIGTSTNPTVADQIRELNNKLMQGYPGVEIGTLSFYGGRGAGFADIPKFVFEEVARLARVNNIQLSMHAPVEELQVAGIGDRGNITPESKNKVVNMVSAVLEAAAHMSKIYGQSLKVNFHAGDVQTTIWKKDIEEKLINYLRTNKEKFNEIKEILHKWGYISNPNEIKDPSQLPPWVFSFYETLYFTIDKDVYQNIGGVGGWLMQNKILGAEIAAKKGVKLEKEEIETIVDYMIKSNREVWEQYFIRNMFNMLREVNRYLPDNPVNRNHPLYQLIIGTFIERNPNYLSYYASVVNDLKSKIENVLEMIEIIKRNIDMSNPEAYKNYKEMLEKKKKELEDLKKGLENYSNKIYNIWNNEEYRKGIENGDHKVIAEILRELDIRSDTFGYERENYILYKAKKVLEDTYRVFKVGETFYNVPLVRPAQEVLIQSAADTFKRALEIFLERNKNLVKLEEIFPTIVIENSYPESVASRPDLLVKYVEKIREAAKEVLEKNPEIKNQIVEKYGSVDKFLDERIGITLDVSHLKMFQKYGYTIEDIKQWLRNPQLRKYIKHIHLAESQWGKDTHLPVQFSWDDFVKQEMEELKDLLAKKGISIVHEAGGWYTSNFFQSYGSEFGYYLHSVQPYGMSGYYQNLFGQPLPYFSYSSPIYQPAIFVPSSVPGLTQPYSPYSFEIFSGLPPETGAIRRGPTQTFTGTPLE